ncbi:uncharacterized protein [Nicotiana sylvestris]|uniref:uncharacterized protein n=1 Tax=Nicotiana sylvestris TaxID=4096 RepID=UPI00388C509E
MSFDLKNTGATYMRAMTTIFNDMIHKEIEVYVDNVIIKFKRDAYHIADLRKFFDRLRRYNLKLNPAKCVFGVPTGKLLGFIERTLPKLTTVGGYSLMELQISKEWGIGAVLVSETGQHYSMSTKLRFLCTNNMAEYETCILGLNMAIDMNIQELLVIGYSDLLVHQVQEEYATKNSKILPYLHHVHELRKRFTKIEFRHVPKIQKEFADALATLSSMIQHPDKNFIDPIPVRIYNRPTYCAHVEEETYGKPQFHDIKEYLTKREYPDHANHTQKRTLRRLYNHFFHSGGNLYRRTPDLGLLRCVNTKEASKLLEEIHARTCGPHMNGFVLAKKILSADYFWMTMETDCA